MKRSVSLIEQRTAVTATVKVEADSSDKEQSHDELVREAEKLFKEAYTVAHTYSVKKNT